MSMQKVLSDISTAAQSSNRLRTLAALNSRSSTVPPIPNIFIDLILPRRFSFLRCSMFLRSRFSFGVIAMVIRCSYRDFLPAKLPPDGKACTA